MNPRMARQKNFLNLLGLDRRTEDLSVLQLPELWKSGIRQSPGLEPGRNRQFVAPAQDVVNAFVSLPSGHAVADGLDRNPSASQFIGTSTKAR